MSTRGEFDTAGLLGPESYPETTALPELTDISGMEVRDIDGEKIGTVDDAYTDAAGGWVRYLSVSTGWFGTKRHLIPVDEVRLERSTDEPYLVVPYDKDLLKEGPAFGRDEDVTYAHEDRVYGHYGRTGYWDPVRARQEAPAATPEIARAEEGTAEELRARQTSPAPTPEIAEAEVADAVRRGKDPNGVAVKRWGV